MDCSRGTGHGDASKSWYRACMKAAYPLTLTAKRLNRDVNTQLRCYAMKQLFLFPQIRSSTLALFREVFTMTTPIRTSTSNSHELQDITHQGYTVFNADQSRSSSNRKGHGDRQLRSKTPLQVLPSSAQTDPAPIRPRSGPNPAQNEVIALPPVRSARAELK